MTNADNETAMESSIRSDSLSSEIKNEPIAMINIKMAVYP